MPEVIPATPVPVPAVARPPMWLVAHLWDAERRPGTKAIDWAVDNFGNREDAENAAMTEPGGVVFYLPGSDEVQP